MTFVIDYKDIERVRTIFNNPEYVKEDDLPLLLDLANNTDFRKHMLRMFRYLSSLSCVKLIIKCNIGYYKQEMFYNLLIRKNINEYEFVILNQNLIQRYPIIFIADALFNEHTGYISLAKKMRYSDYITALKEQAKYSPDLNNFTIKLCKEENIEI